MKIFRLNRIIISPSFAMRTFDENGSENIEEVCSNNTAKVSLPSLFMDTSFYPSPAFCIIQSKAVYDDCHYQGTIRGVKDSSVVLNTCKGLR